MKSIYCFAILAFAFLSTHVLPAQSAYKGFYTGLTYLEITGAITLADRPVGPAIFTIDETGFIFGNLEGRVDATGAITWNANDIGFTTGQIDGNGQLTASVTVDQGPTVTTTRIEAQNQAGGFGRDANSIAYKFDWLSPLPVSGNLADVTYGDGRFVAVGDGGIAAFSGDGENWFSLPIPSGVDFNGVAYGNGLWVVAGDNNTAYISSDLESWTPVVIGGVNIYDVEFANGKFYAGTLNAGIMSSTDGVSWTQVYAGTNAAITSIQFLNGLLIAQYDSIFSNAGTMLLSTNGTNWTTVGLANGIAGRATYGNGMWVFPFTGKRYRFSQTNGSDLASVDIAHTTTSMGFINGKFIDGDYYVSSDAVTWTQATGLPFSAPSNEQHAFETNGDILVAVGESIVSTEDAATFTLRSSRPVDTTLRLFTVLQGGGKWLLTGDGVTAVSTDLEHWTTTPQTAKQFENAAYGAGKFIATGPGPGAQPVVYQSTDGVNWQIVGTAGQYDFEAIAYGGGRWVAASASDKRFYHSVDGAAWVAGQSFSGHQIFDIEYLGGEFIAVGTTSFLSDDGLGWSGGIGGTGALMYDVDYADGIFVAVGATNTTTSADGRLSTSTDGLHWTSRTPGTIEALFGVRHAAGTWVAVGANNTGDHGATVLESTNGLDWEISYLNFDGDLFGLEAANGRMIAVGQNGTVLSIAYGDTGSPYVKEHPLSQSVNEGAPLTLTVDFGGNDPVDIQWLKDGEPIFDGLRISGSRTATLVIDNALPSDAGSYTVALTNDEGGATSLAAQVTVSAKPTITNLSSSQVVSLGGTTQFAVTAENAVSYQWYLNGDIIPGATSATYVISDAQPNDVGAYHVVVSNLAGDTTSSTASLSVRTGSGGELSLALDSAFNGNAPELAATLGFNGNMLHEVSEVLVQADGKVIVTGLFEYIHPTLGKRGSIVRLNTDGSIDATFQPPTFTFSSNGTYVVSKISSATLLSDGRLIIACVPQKIGAAFGSGSGGSTNTKRFLRLNSDGSWDSSFALSPEPTQTTIGLASDSQDRILIASYYVNFGSSHRKVARFLSNGTLDASFANAQLVALDQPVDYPFLIQDDGDILVATYYNGYNSMGVAHLTDAGAIIKYEPDVESSWIQRLIPTATGGGFYVLGSFDTVEGRTQYGIARADAEGSLDNAYVGPGFIEADFWHGVELPDQTFIAVGPYETGNTANDQRGIFRLDAQNGLIMDDPVIGNGFGQSQVGISYTYEYARAAAIDYSRNAVYLAGNMQTLNGVAIPEIVKLTYSSGSGGNTEALEIVAHPKSVQGERGENVTLSVGAIGGNLTFQWYQDGVELPGETGSSLSLTLNDANKIGDYHVVVTDDSGFVESDIATVSFPQSYSDFVSQSAGGQDPMDFNPTAGMRNVFAFAFDASDGDRSKLPRQSLATGFELGLANNWTYLVLQYRQRLHAPGLRIIPRLSDHPDTLFNGAGLVVRLGSPVIDGDSAIYTYRSLYALEEMGRLFMDVAIYLDEAEAE